MPVEGGAPEPVGKTPLGAPDPLGNGTFVPLGRGKGAKPDVVENGPEPARLDVPEPGRFVEEGIGSSDEPGTIDGALPNPEVEPEPEPEPGTLLGAAPAPAVIVTKT